MFKGHSLMPLITQLKTIFVVEIVDFAFMNDDGFVYTYGDYHYTQSNQLAEAIKELKKSKKLFTTYTTSDNYFTVIYYNQKDVYLCITFFETSMQDDLLKEAGEKLNQASFFSDYLANQSSLVAPSHDIGIVSFEFNGIINLFNQYAMRIFDKNSKHIDDLKPYIKDYESFYAIFKQSTFDSSSATLTFENYQNQTFKATCLVDSTLKLVQFIITPTPIDSFYGNILESFDHLKLGLVHCVLIKDSKGKYSDAKIAYANESYAHMMNIQLDQFIGKTLFELYPDFTASRFRRYAHVALTGKSLAFDDYIESYNKYYHIYCYSPRKNEFINVYYETTSYYHLVETRNIQLQKIQMMLKLAEVGFFELDRNKKTIESDVYANSIFGVKNLDYETYRNIFKTRLHDDDYEYIIERNKQLVSGEINEGNAIFRLYSQNRKKIKYVEIYLSSLERDINNRAVKILGIVRDITDRKEAEKQISYYADHDVLTELYNRRYLENALKRNQFKYPFKIAILDLDGLKIINDLFGHDRGDYVIKKFAEALSDIYDKATIVRHGGDEFLVIDDKGCNDFENHEITLREQLSNVLDVYVPLGVSIGYETIEENANFSVKIRMAEESMYRKKLLERPLRKKQTLDVLERHLHFHEPYLSSRISRLQKLCIQLMNAHGYVRHEEQRLMELVVRYHAIGRVNSYIHKTKQGPIIKLYQYLNVEAGFKILSNLLEEDSVRRSILHISEYYNGTGYPHQIKGQNIPIYSRILAICVRYDMFTNPEESQKSLSSEEALKQLNAYNGRRYDPDLLKTFTKLIEEQ